MIKQLNSTIDEWAKPIQASAKSVRDFFHFVKSQRSWHLKNGIDQTGNNSAKGPQKSSKRKNTFLRSIKDSTQMGSRSDSNLMVCCMDVNNYWWQ